MTFKFDPKEAIMLADRQVAAIYRKQGRTVEADALERRANTIAEELQAKDLAEIEAAR